MKLLNKQDLLKKQELKIEKVVLSNDSFVFVREMTGRERDQFERSLYKLDSENKISQTLEDFRAKLAVNTICDEKGNLILDAKDYADLSKNISASMLEKIVNKAQELNKITEEDKEALVKK